MNAYAELSAYAADNGWTQQDYTRVGTDGDYVTGTRFVRGTDLSVLVDWSRTGTVVDALATGSTLGRREVTSRDTNKRTRVLAWLGTLARRQDREERQLDRLETEPNATWVAVEEPSEEDTAHDVAPVVLDGRTFAHQLQDQARGDSSYDLAPATDLAPAMVVNTTRGARSVWERLAREASLDTLERVNASAHWSVTDLGHKVVEEELERRAVATWTDRAATMTRDDLERMATAEHTWELVRTIVRAELDRRTATGHGTLVDSMNALDRAMAPAPVRPSLVDSMNALDRAMAPIVRTGRDHHTARISPALAHQTIVSVTGAATARWER